MANRIIRTEDLVIMGDNGNEVALTLAPQADGTVTVKVDMTVSSGTVHVQIGLDREAMISVAQRLQALYAQVVD